MLILLPTICQRVCQKDEKINQTLDNQQYKTIKANLKIIKYRLVS